MKEEEIFKLIKIEIFSIQRKTNKPVRVAINGIEGTGKKVFSKKLTDYLNAEKLKAIQVSIDGFHFNKEVRYKQGKDSAQGYYENSYAEKIFVEKVLLSSQKNNPVFTKAIHNLETDEYLNIKPTKIDNDTILLTDGAYLFKPVYRKHWDLKIYLQTSFEIAMERGIERDKKMLGGYDLTKEKYEKRYHKASRIYQTENNPLEIADIIIENSDFDNLKLINKTL